MNAGDLLVLGLGVTGGWIIYFWLWPATVVEWYRDALFSLRAEFFDYMADGNIDSRHPAYRLLREQMNSSLRFAHELTFVRVLLYSRASRARPGYRPRGEFRDAVLSLEDPRVRQSMLSFERRWLAMTGLLICGRSAVLLAAALVISAYDYFGASTPSEAKTKFVERADSKVNVDPVAWEQEWPPTMTPAPC